MIYLQLVVAIAFEVAGTTALQASQQFTRFWPSLAVVVCYGLAFFFLAQVLQAIPVGIAYAIWSGLGIVFISLIGLVLFDQRLDFWAVLGLGLIIAGVLIVNLLSKSISH